jgi:hypothetical protein
VVLLHDSFKLGEHLCLVMEAMHMNLRKALKTYGASQGIAIKAVCGYACIDGVNGWTTCVG